MIKRLLIPIVVLVMLVLTGCGQSPTASPAPAPAGEETAAVPTDMVPTPDPTPLPVSQVWLVTGNSIDPAGIRTILQEQAANLSFEYIEKTEINTSEITDNVKVVVLLSVPENLAELSASAPQTHFVTIDTGSLEPSTNLSLIRANGQHTAFVAGFITQLIAPDYRGAGLFFADNPDAANLQDSFLNGGRYLCGRCVPIYAPVVFFPLAATLPAGADSTALRAAYDELDKNRLEVLFLPSQGLTVEFLDHVITDQTLVISTAELPAPYENQAVVVVSADLTAGLAELLPDILTGMEGQAVSAPVVLQNIQEQYITPGKQRMIDQVIQDLRNGWIQPLSVPQ